MNCEQFQAAVVELLAREGDTLGPGPAGFEKHVQNCQECRSMYRRLAGAWKSLDLLAAVPRRQTDEAVRRLIAAADSVGETHESPGRVRSSRLAFRDRLLIPVAAATAALAIGIGIGQWRASDSTGRQLEARVEALEGSLLAARLTRANASERLLAIQQGSVNAEESIFTDALLRSLEEDPNVNVRLAAIEALSSHMRSKETVERAARAANDDSSPLVQLAIVQHLDALPEGALRTAALGTLRPEHLAPDARSLATQLQSRVR